MKIFWHPVFVHFPIAFYFLEFLMLVFWMKKSDENYLHFAAVAFWLGYFFMLASLISGYVAAGGWGHIEGATRRHFLMALSVFIFYSIRAVYWKTSDRASKGFCVVQIGGAVFGNILVGYTAYLGGILVYA